MSLSTFEQTHLHYLWSRVIIDHFDMPYIYGLYLQELRIFKVAMRQTQPHSLKQLSLQTDGAATLCNTFIGGPAWTWTCVFLPCFLLIHNTTIL